MMDEVVTERMPNSKYLASFEQNPYYLSRELIYKSYLNEKTKNVDLNGGVLVSMETAPKRNNQELNSYSNLVGHMRKPDYIPENKAETDHRSNGYNSAPRIKPRLLEKRDSKAEIIKRSRKYVHIKSKVDSNLRALRNKQDVRNDSTYNNFYKSINQRFNREENVRSNGNNMKTVADNIPSDNRENIHNAAIWRHQLAPLDNHQLAPDNFQPRRRTLSAHFSKPAHLPDPEESMNSPSRAKSASHSHTRSASVDRTLSSLLPTTLETYKLLNSTNSDENMRNARLHNTQLRDRKDWKDEVKNNNSNTNQSNHYPNSLPPNQMPYRTVSANQRGGEQDGLLSSSWSSTIFDAASLEAPYHDNLRDSDTHKENIEHTVVRTKPPIAKNRANRNQDTAILHNNKSNAKVTSNRREDYVNDSLDLNNNSVSTVRNVEQARQPETPFSQFSTTGSVNYLRSLRVIQSAMTKHEYLKERRDNTNYLRDSIDNYFHAPVVKNETSSHDSNKPRNNNDQSVFLQSASKRMLSLIDSLNIHRANFDSDNQNDNNGTHIPGNNTVVNENQSNGTYEVSNTALYHDFNAAPKQGQELNNNNNLPKRRSNSAKQLYNRQNSVIEQQQDRNYGSQKMHQTQDREHLPMLESNNRRNSLLQPIDTPQTYYTPDNRPILKKNKSVRIELENNRVYVYTPEYDKGFLWPVDSIR